MTTPIVIGVDGGGTQLRVVLAAPDGRILGSGRSGPGNYHDVGLDGVRANLEDALDQAFSMASVRRRPADAAFLGMASVVSENDHRQIRSLVADVDLAPDERTGVGHDLRIALAGGLAGEPGIALIVGTGSSCYGRDYAGASWRAGGWGSTLDDRGSSTWLGLEAMIATIRDHDGRGPHTVIRERIIDTLGLTDIQEIMYHVDGANFSRREIAKLARIVTHAASEGDVVAHAIIARGSDELALMVETVATRLNFSETCTLAITGGLLNAGSVIVDPLHDAILQRVPNIQITPARLTPVHGAALLACDVLGQPLRGAALATFERESQESTVLNDHEENSGHD